MRWLRTDASSHQKFLCAYLSSRIAAHIWPYKIVGSSVMCAHFDIHSMILFIDNASPCDSIFEVSMNTFGYMYILRIFFLSVHLNQKSVRKRKQFAQGHIHLPISAKFHYFIRQNAYIRFALCIFFSLSSCHSTRSRLIGVCVFALFFFVSAIALAFVSHLIICHFLHYRFNLSFYVHIKYINEIYASLHYDR